MVGSKRNVGVQVSDKVELRRFQEFETRIDGIGLAAEMTVRPVDAADERNPWKARGIIFYDFSRPIR
jgi:hypothetical protein